MWGATGCNAGRLGLHRTALSEQYRALEERVTAEQALCVQLQLLQEREASLYAQLQVRGPSPGLEPLPRCRVQASAAEKALSSAPLLVPH